MEKAFFFESNEGCLHRCILAGIDQDGRPQWLMADQGDEVMTLQEYMEINMMENEGMRLLCLDGETLESTTMARLLGAVLQGYPVNNAEALTDTIKELRRRGIAWKQEKLQLAINVREYYDEVMSEDACRFYANCRCAGIVLELDAFHTLKDLMTTIRCYFDALDSEAGIGLEKELRSNNIHLLEELDERDVMMFDKIS